jgi:transcriptional regulator with XRE-family HTH domain
MLTLLRDDPPDPAIALSQILKALRRRRGLTAAETAAAMGLPQRSFEHFEGGRGRLNLERLQKFGEVTDTDAFAVLLALILGDPAFAVRCADNKLATILLMSLSDFQRGTGESVSRLDPRALFAAFDATFAALAEEARAREMALPSR